MGFMQACSSRDAAKELGISMMTLHRHITSKRIKAPRLQKVGGVTVRLWSKADIERARKMMERKSRSKH